MGHGSHGNTPKAREDGKKKWVDKGKSAHAGAGRKPQTGSGQPKTKPYANPNGGKPGKGGQLPKNAPQSKGSTRRDRPRGGKSNKK